MGVFPRFGSWINQNSQQPLKAESKKSENVDSEKDNFELPDKVYYDINDALKQNELWHEAEMKHPWHNASPKIKVTHENGLYHMNIELTVGLAPNLVYNLLIDPNGGPFQDRRKRRRLTAESKKSENVDSEKDNFELPDKVYYDINDALKQNELWHEAEMKHPWHNASPKIKVTHENGLYHMNIELTVGLAPNLVYNLLIDPNGGPFQDRRKRRRLTENKSRKVLFEKGPRQMTRVEKSVVCNVFGVYIPISMNLILHENRKDLMTQYKKDKVRFMKAFEGTYKVEPIFVDKERLCKKKIPTTEEEYKKCSGGQGKLASKLTIDQYYQPYPPFNLPPLSWFIRGMTTKTYKSLLAQLQDMSIAMRTATPIPKETSSTNKHEKH